MSERAPAIQFDAAQASAYLGVTVTQLQRQARAGLIAHTRIGRSYRFSQDDLDDYLARGRREVITPVRDARIPSISARTAVRHRRRRSA